MNLTGKPSIPTCDVCGSPATNATRDMQEVESDNKCRQYKPKSTWRYGCDEHPVQDAVTFGLDGRPDKSTWFAEQLALAEMRAAKMLEERTAVPQAE